MNVFNSPQHWHCSHDYSVVSQSEHSIVVCLPVSCLSHVFVNVQRLRYSENCPTIGWSFSCLKLLNEPSHRETVLGAPPTAWPDESVPEKQSKGHSKPNYDQAWNSFFMLIIIIYFFCSKFLCCVKLKIQWTLWTCRGRPHTHTKKGPGEFLQGHTTQRSRSIGQIKIRIKKAFDV